MIPGEDLRPTESDLLQAIGRLQALYDNEQRKYIIIAQAYLALKKKYEPEQPPVDAAPTGPNAEEEKSPETE